MQRFTLKDKAGYDKPSIFPKECEVTDMSNLILSEKGFAAGQELKRRSRRNSSSLLRGGRSSSYLFFALIFSLCLPITACGPDMTIMSEQQEAQIGAREHAKIVKHYGGVYDDPGVTAYVNQIMKKVAAASDRPDIPFRITVLDSPIVNAFALPGGYTYVTRGLLALANSEAEVAAVIGHEIGHVTARHSAQRQTAAVGTALLAGVLGAVINQQAPGNKRVVNDLVDLGSSAVLAGYSRSQEYEADDIGVRTSAGAGYQPEAAADFLASLGRESEFEKKLSGGKSAPEWLASHPSTDERVARAREISAPYFLDRKNFRLGRDTHLAAINGMTYGETMKSGYVSGQSFLHPELKLRFAVPKGFKLKNGEKAVVATDDQEQSIVFDMDRRDVNLGDYVSQYWIRGDGHVRTETQISGAPALRIKLTSSQKYREALAIKGEGGQIFRFLISLNQSDGGRAMDALMASIRLNDPTVRPLQIQVVTVRAGQTVSGLANQMVVPDNPVERFRLLNGLQEGDGLKVGQKIKLIR